MTTTLGVYMTLLHFLLAPAGQHPEFATTALEVVVVQEADPYYLLVGKGKNLHGDIAPLHGSAMRDGEGFRVSLVGTLDTSHEVPYRGYYILSMTLHLDANLEGVTYIGNVDVDHATVHNDYSVHPVQRISQEEWEVFGQSTN